MLDPVPGPDGGVPSASSMAARATPRGLKGTLRDSGAAGGALS